MLVYLPCLGNRHGGHDRPLRAGIHAAARPVLGPGGDRLREEAFALGAFASQFARPTNGFGFPTRLGLGRLLVSGAGLHFAEDALALHLLLEGLQRLVDVVVPDHDNYDLKLSIAARLWFSHAGYRGPDIMELPDCPSFPGVAGRRAGKRRGHADNLAVASAASKQVALGGGEVSSRVLLLNRPIAVVVGR